MVSASRIWDKIQRAEEKLMAYDAMLKKGEVPKINDVLTLKASRMGEPLLDIEKIRAKQAQFDIKLDIERNLAKMELEWKDYLKHLKERKVDDLIAVVSAIGKKEAVKSAKD